jgi:hypothetical protein
MLTSFFSQKEIHNPTSHDMIAWLAGMCKDALINASGVSQSIAQDRQISKPAHIAKCLS